MSPASDGRSAVLPIPHGPLPVFAVLALSLIGISFAGPLVRLSSAHPIAIAVWRLAFSLVLISVPLIFSRGWRQWRLLGVRNAALAGGAGVMLALHFWSWNTAVGMTSIAAAVVLVNVQPLIVGVVSATWLKEAPGNRQWVGIGIAMIGAIVVASPDLKGSAGLLENRALLGDLLAFAGAVTAALYYLSGRRLRQTLDIWPYVALVYGACFLTLLLIAGLLRVPLAPQPPSEIAIFAALAVGPMLLGHTGMNWALKYLPAYVVNLTTLGEPIGATLLAAVLPGIREIPPAVTLIGGAIVLTGIAVALPKANGGNGSVTKNE
ncbi:MAG: DMT family transporter [Gemmatimonadaceae bacterium]|nr:DMT family transporter [Gemmatimonadaceae bacterium]